jgi:TetR/AcrR family transcriptional regulator
MGKHPPRQDTEQLRSRARAAAVRLFARYGFEGTSVQDIADALKISKQALLYHFDSKEGLRRAALQELVTVWRNALPGLLGGLMDEKARFEDALTEVLALHRAEPAYARFLVRELLQPSRSGRAVLQDVQPWLEMAAGFLREAQRTGKVDASVDPEAWMINLGTFLLATLSLLDEKSLPGKPSPERVVREMARMVGASLRPHQG